ncbi:ABC transporter substrate-binding protein [Desulfovibrio ferrophilus]|nr:ABC transporter substrate-binding protein [Desulfovibrio ferrophilus]
MALPCAAKPPVSFKVTEGKGLMTAAHHVGVENGYFTDEGQSVHMKKFPKGYAALQDYLQGKADMTTINRVSLALTDIDPEEHVVIGILAYNSNDATIVGRRDSGITDAASLRGKRIGTAYGTTSHYWIYKWLAQHGMTSSDVTVEYYKKNKLPEVIASGKVDAIVMGVGVWDKAAKLLGDNAIIFTDPYIDLKQVPLMVRRSLIRDHRTELIAHLRALIRAEEFIKNDPRRGAAIVAQRKNLNLDTVTDLIVNSVDFSLSLKQGLLTDMEIVDRWAIEYKLVQRTRPRNYLEFIDSSLLEEIDPNRVTIIK